jgi:hypothetical protein
MNASLPIDIAEAILWFHVVVIAFNVFGLVAIPLGAWSGWKFVRVFWWRALHLGLLGIVALQAVLGRACFLTIWESDFLRRAGEAASNEPDSEMGQPSYLLASAPLVLRGALRGGLRFHAAVVVACPSAVPSAWTVSVGSGAARQR